MEQKLKNIIEKTLKVTEPLVRASAPSDAKFVNVILGVYRVSFGTLRDIYYLSNNEDAGGNALALTRKMIEYGIAVEYMLWKGKEKMAEQFQKHLFKEIHDEIKFLESIGQNPAIQNKNLKLEVEDAEKNYESLSSNAKTRKSWAGISLEKMMKDLHTAKKLKDFDFSRISQAYVWGCRLNHVNPMVVKNYMEQEDTTIASGFYLQQALLVATLIHIRLTTRYIDEIRLINQSNDYQELADSISSIWNEILAIPD